MFIAILLISFACSDTKEKENEAEVTDKKPIEQIPFDAAKWQIKEKRKYPWRKQMTDELLYTDTLRLLNKEEILSLLGEPDRMDKNYLFYIIDQGRIGYWVLSQQTLVVILSDTSKNKVLLSDH
ncbi:MAG: hypothetical protein KDD94_11870 [Calditrichaeota bacterium]|nr:hypothetical protein [Calditrichota bacterium]